MKKMLFLCVFMLGFSGLFAMEHIYESEKILEKLRELNIEPEEGEPEFFTFDQKCASVIYTSEVGSMWIGDYDLENGNLTHVCGHEKALEKIGEFNIDISENEREFIYGLELGSTKKIAIVKSWKESNNMDNISSEHWGAIYNLKTGSKILDFKNQCTILLSKQENALHLVENCENQYLFRRFQLSSGEACEVMNKKLAGAVYTDRELIPALGIYADKLIDLETGEMREEMLTDE